MQTNPDAPKRPVFRYYGSKWRLAPFIIKLLPEHKLYVEPCCGGAAVLLRKPIAPIEVINDLDGEVVNFFRVLRDNAAVLAAKIEFTPWAAEEYHLAFEMTDDPIERARRFLLRTRMSYDGASSREHSVFKEGWRRRKKGTSPARELETLPDELIATAERLRYVLIENDDWKSVANRYNVPGAVIYMDPPYVSSTRNGAEKYQFEWGDEQHWDMAVLLRSLVSHVVLSGYNCALYKELFDDYGWTRYDIEVSKNSGSYGVESVWLSPSITAPVDTDQEQLL